MCILLKLTVRRMHVFSGLCFNSIAAFSNITIIIILIWSITISNVKCQNIAIFIAKYQIIAKYHIMQYLLHNIIVMQYFLILLDPILCGLING